MIFEFEFKQDRKAQKKYTKRERRGWWSLIHKIKTINLLRKNQEKINSEHMMRTFSHISLLALFCLLGNADAHHHQGCLFVEKMPTFKEPSCESCYRRKPNAPVSVGCGPLVGDQDKCMFYEHIRSAKRTICARCLENYALDVTTLTCVPGKIQGCNAEFLNPNGKRRCYSCTNGYAQLFQNNTSTCIPANQVDKPIANCLWGGVYQKTTQPAAINCYRCQAGYTVTFDSQKCEKGKFPGCLTSSKDGTRCEQCDVFDGFSMQPDFSCLKVGETKKVKSF